MSLVKVFFIYLFIIITSYADTKPLKILIFQSYSHTLPWSKQFMQGIKEFEESSPRKMEFYIETVDHIRLKKQMSPNDWKEYLQKKYKGVNFDGIIVETIFASNILNSFANELFSDIPRIYLSDIKIKKQKNILVGISAKEEVIQQTIKLAKKQNENLENIYIIEPYSNGKAIKNKLLEELSKETFLITVLKDFTIDELKEILANLPKNSVVFYILNFQDKTGKKFVPKDFLKQITQNANAPIYSFWSTFLGTGTIGGYMIDGVTTAKVSLEHLVFYIQNGYFPLIIDFYKLFLDYKVLEKYKIDSSDYLEEATIINKPIPIWESYPKETLFALSTIALLILLLMLTIILKIRNERILKMEESMFVQSKQAAMGEMISVIAHQWRQPLNNVAVIVQTIVLKYKKRKIDDIIMEKFKIDVLKQIHYMSDTIDDFKDFYKPNKEKIEFDIKEELVKTIELIENIYLKKSIKIEIDSIKNFVVRGYPNELSHCFLILLQNGEDALVESAQKNKKIQVSSVVNKEECVIIFQNNGKQIPEEIIGKIFQPYFSTKNEKNGTGIGLYMTKMIIEKHFNGSIEVSNTHNGVKFTIRLTNDK